MPLVKPEISKEWRHDVAAASGQYDLFKLLKSISDMMGFQFFSVLKIPDYELTTLQAMSMVSNWPPELINEYDRNDLVNECTVFGQLRLSNEPVNWTLSALENATASPKAQLAAQLFKDFSLRYGVIFPCTATNKTRGAVAFVGEQKTNDEEVILSLALLSSIIFDRLIHFEGELFDKAIDLTDREEQCLRLMASGLSTGRICEELGISEHTVNHHITILVNKMQAKNRAHAVGLAFQRGILR